MTTPPRFAVIGHPIAHSRSPDIHRAFAKELGIELSYERIDADPDHFEHIVENFFAQGGQGLNVTVPFKERAWQMARRHLSHRAMDAQAVNTLWQQSGNLHGCNTDGFGLVHDLNRLCMPMADQRVLLVGAGGAARGVIGPLLDAGCELLHVINRTSSRAYDLVQQWITTHPSDASRLSAGGLDEVDTSVNWGLVINATASSLQGEPISLPATLFTNNTCAYDMMYGAGDTPFLAQARTGGVSRLADGLGMLVGQAAESFRIWHGQSPAIEPVIDEVRKQLSVTVR